MNNRAGFTLVELVIFIILLSFCATTLLTTLQNLSQRLNTSNRQTIAIMLAQERMEIILGFVQIYGYSSLTTDPCLTSPASSAAICTLPIGATGYTVTATITANYTLNGDSNYKLITVKAANATTGAQAILMTVIGS